MRRNVAKRLFELLYPSSGAAQLPNTQTTTHVSETPPLHPTLARNHGTSTNSELRDTICILNPRAPNETPNITYFSKTIQVSLTVLGLLPLQGQIGNCNQFQVNSAGQTT